MVNVSKYKAELSAKLQELIANGGIDPRYSHIIEHFYENYMNAANFSDHWANHANRQFEFFLNLIIELKNQPFTFEPYHKRILSPIDYYQFGLEFMRPLVARGSFIKGENNLDKILQLYEKGENVVLLANHQTEADPQALSLLLEKKAPVLGAEMIFVAGERVITDPLAVPFSMGRNLLCIYSKRYIDFPPEEKLKKQLHNKKTMEMMSQLFDEGGKCIYVAPSGGRDRKNSEGVIEVAPFDPQSIEMFYLMARKAKKKTHFFPLTLLTYEMLPPPEGIQRELGELRKASHTNIAASFGDEVDMENIVNKGHTDKHEMRRIRAESIWNVVKHEHEYLRSNA